MTLTNQHVTASDRTQVEDNLASVRGMKLSGRTRMTPNLRPAVDHPLVIAIHGGTYTSAYFDVPGYSLLDGAAALGIPSIAFDRPGYGSSTALPPAEATILKNAEILDELIGEIWTQYGAGARGVVLVGHSIGGAVTAAIAARAPAWPLLGIATSGCLLSTPPASHDSWTTLPALPMIDLDKSRKDEVMFGPHWTYDRCMPDASRISDAPVPRAERIDIAIHWAEVVRAVSARIQVPVHHRQGECDPLWITNADEVKAFGATFTASPDVDAKLLAHAGHCIDFHRLGCAFQLDQLAFALRCCRSHTRIAAHELTLPGHRAAFGPDSVIGWAGSLEKHHVFSRALANARA
jgi:pimeloyl-ACP methyl ester carboxylesterase